MRMVYIYFHTSIFISQWDGDRTLTLLFTYRTVFWNSVFSRTLSFKTENIFPKIGKKWSKKIRGATPCTPFLQGCALPTHHNCLAPPPHGGGARRSPAIFFWVFLSIFGKKFQSWKIEILKDCYSVFKDRYTKDNLFLDCLNLVVSLSAFKVLSSFFLWRNAQSWLSSTTAARHLAPPLRFIVYCWRFTQNIIIHAQGGHY